MPEQDIFDVEYWDLEQAKLQQGRQRRRSFAGEVALVTGAASGIGKACVESLLKRGAAVIALDLNADIAGMFARPEVLGLRCDVTEAAQVSQALDRGVRTFGGLDMLVLNAGIFPGGRRVAALADAGVAARDAGQPGREPLAAARDSSSAQARACAAVGW